VVGSIRWGQLTSWGNQPMRKPLIVLASAPRLLAWISLMAISTSIGCALTAVVSGGQPTDSSGTTISVASESLRALRALRALRGAIMPTVMGPRRHVQAAADRRYHSSPRPHAPKPDVHVRTNRRPVAGMPRNSSRCAARTVHRVTPPVREPRDTRKGSTTAAHLESPRPSLIPQARPACAMVQAARSSRCN
jgi:hypothetical protein